MTAVVEPMGEGKTKEKLASTLLWRIENISYWDFEYCNEIESPRFEFLNIGTCRLLLRLNDEKDDKKFKCYLQFNNNTTPLDYEWALLNCESLPVVSRTIRNANMTFLEPVDFLEWPTYEDVFLFWKSALLTNDTLIIRCRFWNSGESFEQAEYLSAYTRIRATETSFIWRIKKFSSLQLEQALIIPFVLSFSGRQVILKLKFSLEGHSLRDSITSFEIISEPALWQIITIFICLFDHEDKAMKTLSSKNSFGAKSYPFEHDRPLLKLVSRQELMDRRYDWLPEDNLTLHCKFQSVMGYMEHKIDKYYKGPENQKIEIPRTKPCFPKTTILEIKITDPTWITSDVPEDISQTSFQCAEDSSIPQHKTKSLATLQKDFLSLYTDHPLFDFEFRSGETSIHVHKNVLIARSPVFKAMFCGEMREATSDCLDIPDIDDHTLNLMLAFMYTGTLDQLDWESAAKLYYAADKYQVQTLKEECLHLLQSGISVQNVSDILELADRHQDRDLELFVHQFLIKNYDEVVLSEEWGTFLNSNSTLAGNVMRDVYTKKLLKGSK